MWVAMGQGIEGAGEDAREGDTAERTTYIYSYIDTGDTRGEGGGKRRDREGKIGGDRRGRKIIDRHG